MRQSLYFIGAVTLAVGVVAAPSAIAVPGGSGLAPSQAGAPTLENMIQLDNCSASLVRFPTSKSSDRAMMLTNAHCYEGGMVKKGVIILNKKSKRVGNVLDADGQDRGEIKADLVMYASDDDSDVALYRLTETFDQVAKNHKGAKPLTISNKAPKAGTKMTIASGYWKQLWHCSIDGFVYTLREDQWDTHSSLRYDAACNTKGGTSGSPVISDETGEVIGINSTRNTAGEMCTMDNPCEIDKNGKKTVRKGQSYGENVYWFTTCLTPKNTIDLKKNGCKLHGGNGGPYPLEAGQS